MKYWRVVLFLLLVGSGVVRAAFTAEGGSGNAPYGVTPAVSTGVESVFVFNGDQQATLSFDSSDPSQWSWYRYTQDPDAAALVEVGNVIVTDTRTTVTNLELNAGYFVKSADGTIHVAYVVAWKPLSYLSLEAVDEGDPCSELFVKATTTGDDMIYYTAIGLKRSLERLHTLNWTTQEWNESKEQYDDKTQSATFTTTGVYWSIPAPLKMTDITVKGDQFNQWFGVEESTTLSNQQANAVKANPSYTVQLRDNDNESGASTGDLTGSAPLTITFKAHPSDAVTVVEWNVYKPGTSGDYAHFTGDELVYTFKESGKYTVKMVASNRLCSDSAEFTPQVYESMLDCPNFFTPRSSPGENDLFKVAYKSIISFKGIIVNRLGNVLFQWTDPSVGWDGTFKGKAVSPGVYFYSIKAKGSDGLTYHKKGAINLLE